MIIAHFFLRNVRKQPYLFVETTSSQGLEQPSPAAQMLVGVSESERRQEWVKKAYYAFTNKFPNLVLVDAMENTLRLESDRPSFDLVFRPAVMPEGTREKLIRDGAAEKPVLSVIKNLFKNKSGDVKNV